MMKKYLSIILSIFTLAGVIVGTIIWSQAFYQSAKNYQSPLQAAILQPQPPDAPQLARVVVVLVSGLGQDAFDLLELPVLKQLAQTGASCVVQSQPPTYAQTSGVTLLTGAPPETNDAPPFDLPPEALSLVDVDTIFARAHQAQLKTSLFGPEDWQRLIPRNLLDDTFFVNSSGPEADQAILEAALPLLKAGNIDLTFIHLTQLEFAARYQGGPAGSVYRQAAARIDGYLGQISRAADLNQSALLIVSDHGHIEAGGHGGNEIEITRQPLVMVGKRIAPGSYSSVSHTDIAPTVAALLGVAPPTTGRGRILFEMLRFDEQEQAALQLALAGQHLLLAQAYLAEIGGPNTALPDNLFTDLFQAQTALAQGNIAGAIQLAQLAQETANVHMVAARRSRLRAEQWPRLLAASVLLLLWSVILWRRRNAYVGLIIFAAIVTVGLYHLLYQLQGFGYSISYLNDFSNLPFSVARRTAVSLLAGGGLLLILLMLVNEDNWVTLLGTGYGFGVLVTFVFILPLFWAFWQNGFVIDWHLPAVGPVFWQITALFEAMIAAILGLFLPWPIMFLNLFVNFLRRSLDESQPRPEPDALPGLHL